LAITSGRFSFPSRARTRRSNEAIFRRASFSTVSSGGLTRIGRYRGTNAERCDFPGTQELRTRTDKSIDTSNSFPDSSMRHAAGPPPQKGGNAMAVNLDAGKLSTLRKLCSCLLLAPIKWPAGLSAILEICSAEAMSPHASFMLTRDADTFTAGCLMLLTCFHRTRWSDTPDEGAIWRL
jgi:hypothetical protein